MQNEDQKLRWKMNENGKDCVIPMLSSKQDSHKFISNKRHSQKKEGQNKMWEPTNINSDNIHNLVCTKH